MHICHITSAHPRYDIRIFVKECKSLARNLHQVTLIVADGLGDEIHNFEDNYVINILDVGVEAKRLDRIRKTPTKIYQEVIDLKPDFVHFHDPELMFIASKIQKQKINVVYDVHEDLPKQIQNKHWLPKWSRNLVAYFAKEIEKHVARKIHGVITATPIIMSRFKTYNPNTYTICNYPILKELETNNEDVDYHKRENSLCYIGSISKPRGIVPLIESLALSKINLKLAGKFSSDTTLEELNKLSGITHVDYLGVLNRQEIVELLNKVKIGMVTLLPTPSYIESLPIKMFEYMLSGIPVIASNFSLWAEIIHKYNCGIMVDPNDIEEIAKACCYLLDNPAIAAEMGQNGRGAVIKYFNWEQEEKKLIDFYAKKYN